jgi:hypothetical protein
MIMLHIQFLKSYQLQRFLAWVLEHVFGNKGVLPAVSLVNGWFKIPNIRARIPPQQGSSRVWTTHRILIAETPKKKKKCGTI